MAAEEPLPKSIFAHGWLLFEQQKMSKSKGNVAYPEPIARTVGADALRYYLLREVSFGQDGNFSHDALLTRYNSDLANGLGNLASRTLSMIARYCEGKVPAPSPYVSGEPETSLAEALGEAIRTATKEYEELSFSRALETIWNAVAQVDGYLTAQKPWTLAAEDQTMRVRLETVLYCAAEALRIVVALAHPALPEATPKIWAQLGQFSPLRDFRLDQLAWGGLRPGTSIGEVAPVFPRIEKSEVLEKIAAMEEEITKPAQPAAPAGAVPGHPAVAAAPAAAAAKSGKIHIDDFLKVEMRVGQVKSAEKVAGADKLLKVMVDLGDEVRQIVAGIATVYSPEQLVGRKVVVVCNLEPRKLRGVESNGMIVAASTADGSPVLAGFLEDVPVGAKLK
jgi:methionyl-tRNA synthetase